MTRIVLKLSFFALGIFFHSVVFAEVVAGGAGGANGTQSLPHCVDDPVMIQNIKETLKNNKGKPTRYNGYREALRSASDEELFARLAYAETLGANCADQNDPISSRIVNVIGNRVMRRQKDVKSVVFQASQFASSLHVYDSSKYMDFLCPKDPKLWSQILNKVRNFMQKGSGDLSADTMNYFLYKHDPRWTKEPEDWKIYPEDKKGASEQLRACLRTFHIPNWK